MTGEAAEVCELVLPEAYEVLGDANSRDAWLELRREGVGASEISAVLGESPWLSATELYALKTGAQPEEDLAHVEFVYWGLQLEPSIVIGYQHRTGRAVEHSGKLLRSRQHPWALCTLDSWTEHEPGRWQPLEIKNVGTHKAAEWEFGPPRHYYLQLQQQMLVTGAESATIAALIGGQRMVWCDVERDPIEQRRIAHAGRIFWQAVQGGTPPRPDGSDSASRALQALYPEHNEKIVRLGDDADELFWRLQSIKAEQKKLKDERDQIEQLFKASIGDAQEALLPSRAVVSWKKNARGAVDWKGYALALGGNESGAEKHRRRAPRVLRTHEPKS